MLKQVLEEAKSIGSVTDNSQAFIDIAAAYARMGDLKAALEIADTLGNGKMSALERIGITQAETGDIEALFGRCQLLARISQEPTCCRPLPPPKRNR